MPMPSGYKWSKPHPLKGVTRSVEFRAHVSAGKTTHGHTRPESPTYRAWGAMKTRCTNPNQPKWKYYGGRGITVCHRWSRFENFLADMGEKPAGLTLDRIDVNGNYEPGNCRWATWHEQRVNQRPMSRPA